MSGVNYGITCDLDGNRQVRAIIHADELPQDEKTRKAIEEIVKAAALRFDQETDAR